MQGKIGALKSAAITLFLTLATSTSLAQSAKALEGKSTNSGNSQKTSSTNKTEEILLLRCRGMYTNYLNGKKNEEWGIDYILKIDFTNKKWQKLEGRFGTYFSENVKIPNENHVTEIALISDMAFTLWESENAQDSFKISRQTGKFAIRSTARLGDTNIGWFKSEGTCEKEAGPKF